MAEQSVEIKNPSGLHARPASLLVKEAASFQSKVTLKKGDKEVDAKSILGIMSLAIQKGETVTIRAEGADEDAAVKHLTELIANGLGETQA